MSRIFISHPFSSDPEANRTHVLSIARRVSIEGHLPLAPQIYFPQFLDEATERELAMRLCLRMVAMADEVRVYGDPTEGMLVEIAEAERLGIPIIREGLP